MRHLFLSLACLVAGLVTLTVAAPDAAAVTGPEAVDRAMEWVNAGLPYCQCPNHSTDSHGVCNRTDNPAWDAYRTDCSGLVSYAWGLPAPGRVTSTLWGVATIIDAADLQPGDAIDSDDHTMLFAGWTHFPDVANLIDEHDWGTDARRGDFNVTISGSSFVRSDWPSNPFQAIRYNGLTAACNAHCEGNTIVGTDCGKGDCGAFGSTCVDDAAGVRCVSFACPADGDTDVCIPETEKVAHCSNGAISNVGDCAVYGSTCVSDSLGARCDFFACPAQGESDVCVPGTQQMAHCSNGGVTSKGDCGVFGALCSTDGGLHCIAPYAATLVSTSTITGSKVCAGADVDLSFDVRDDGYISWTDTGDTDAQHVGTDVRLGTSDGTNKNFADPLMGGTRVSVKGNTNPDVVASGPDCSNKSGCQRTIFHVTGKATTKPGTYVSSWQLVDELRAWFGPVMSQTITVEACGGDDTGAGGSAPTTTGGAGHASAGHASAGSGAGPDPLVPTTVGMGTGGSSSDSGDDGDDSSSDTAPGPNGTKPAKKPVIDAAPADTGCSTGPRGGSSSGGLLVLAALGVAFLRRARSKVATATAAAALVTGCAMPSEPAPEADVGERRAAVVSCPGADTVQGVDVSHYQGAIDWGQVAGSGRRFAYAQVGDGTGFMDPTFQTNWAGIKNAGMLRGAYQFFEPSEDPIAQADLLIQAMGTLGPGDLPPMIDMEKDGANGGQTTAAMKAWLDHVEQAIGRKPFIYTGYYFWTGDMGNPQGFGDYKFWDAAYTNDCPLVPDEFGGLTFWQYTSSGYIPGIGSSIDHDIFNGTFEQLSALTFAPACQAHCEGNTIVGADCGKGDCAAFGSSCVDDDLGARCVSFVCPAKGDSSACVPTTQKIASCSNGAVTSIGDCAVFGSTCDQDALGARCVSFACPATGEKDVCIPTTEKMAHCSNGAITEVGDCGVFGAACSTDGSLHCIAPYAATVVTPPADVAKVCAGAAVDVAIELENDGYVAWSDTGDKTAKDLGTDVRLGTSDGTTKDLKDPLVGVSRISVNDASNANVHDDGPDCTIAGCKKTIFHVKGTATTNLGKVTSTWQLVDETRAWFGPVVAFEATVVKCDDPPPAAGGSGGAPATTGTGGEKGGQSGVATAGHASGGSGLTPTVGSGGDPASAGAAGSNAMGVTPTSGHKGGSAGADDSDDATSGDGGNGCNASAGDAAAFAWLPIGLALFLARRRRAALRQGRDHEIDRQIRAAGGHQLRVGHRPRSEPSREDGGVWVVDRGGGEGQLDHTLVRVVPRCEERGAAPRASARRHGERRCHRQ